MKKNEKGNRRLSNELIWIFVGIIEILYVLFKRFLNSYEYWYFYLLPGILLILIPILKLRKALKSGEVYRESKDSCFSILRDTMDRGKAVHAEILGISYYNTTIDAGDTGKISVSLVLRIIDAGKEPYEVSLKTYLPKNVVTAMKEGDKIPILIDRLNPKKITLDLDMMSKDMEIETDSD